MMGLLLWGFTAGCGDDATRDGSADGGGPADASGADVADAAADDVSEALALVDHELWTTASADPFDDAPADVDCDSQAWGSEEIAPELTFFVQTQGCNYLTVSQPISSPIEAGQTLNIRLWHYKLTAPAATEAHLALRLGDHLIWEAFVPIPSQSQLLMDTWTAPSAIPAGEDIYFHVHNHGDNEYNLIEVSLSR
jgi:hypothetical protein